MSGCENAKPSEISTTKDILVHLECMCFCYFRSQFCSVEIVVVYQLYCFSVLLAIRIFSSVNEHSVRLIYEIVYNSHKRMANQNIHREFESKVLTSNEPNKEMRAGKENEICCVFKLIRILIVYN